MGKQRVLIVDDDPVSCRILFECFTRLDFHVKVARSCANALEEIKNQEIPYDGVVCDIMLPDGSGKDLLTRLRDEGSALPFFFVSGDEEMTDALAKKLGAQGFLKKPIQAEYLKTRIAAQIVRKK